MTLALGPVRATWTSRTDGDLRPDVAGGDRGDALARWLGHRTGVPGGPPVDGVRRVHTATQVHGCAVVDVDALPGCVSDPPGTEAGIVPVHHGEADVLVTSQATEAVAVLAADCGTVVLASPEGHAAAVHSGWSGLVVGAVQAGADALRRRGASRIVGAVGPCIHAPCYGFSSGDVDRVAAVVGPTVRARTSAGQPALDLPAGLRAALEAAGVTEAPGLDRCTACASTDGPGDDPAYFSHRARADGGRHALVVWTAGLGATS